MRCRSCFRASLFLWVALPALAHANQWGWEVDGDLEGQLLPRLPSTVSVDPSVTGRNASAGNVPLGVGVATAGISGEAGLVFDDHFVVPLFGLRNAVAVGRSSGVISSLAGSIEVKPYTLGEVAFLFPGLGYRWRYRQVALQARLEPWLTLMWMHASVYSGPSFVSDDMPSVWGFALQARVEACWRIDPTTRCCGFVSPNLWAERFLNGGTAGMRWEVDVL
jgi:hypothetical protein